MTRLLLITLLCALTARAAEFTASAHFDFVPLTGSMPAPNGESFRVAFVSNLPNPAQPSLPLGCPADLGGGQFGPSLWICETVPEEICPSGISSDWRQGCPRVQGAPMLGEEDSFGPGATAVYEITHLVNDPSHVEFGVEITGEADPADTIIGFGSKFRAFTAYPTDVGFAGTLSVDFGCSITVSEGEPAYCSFRVSTYSRSEDADQAPVADQIAIPVLSTYLRLSGDATASWDGSEITVAGSSYHLTIYYTREGVRTRADIVASGGTIASSENSSEHVNTWGHSWEEFPFTLPAVASSSSFSMAATVLPLEYDVRDEMGDRAFERLYFDAMCGTVRIQ